MAITGLIGRSIVADTLDDVDQRAHGDYAVGQWLSGNTARAFRPTRDELEAAGYIVVKREDLAKAGVAVLTVSELGALIDVCRGGVSTTGSATDALRHIERRLRARLEQIRTPPCA